MRARKHPCCTSVIIPVRNGARYLAEAMRSALEQIEADSEIIIVDDGSTDDTVGVAEAAADGRVLLMTNPGRGVSAARNTGLAAANGEFIAFLDHDDVWPEGRHQALLGKLRTDSSIDAAFGRIRVAFAPGISPLPEYLEIDGKYVPKGSLCSGLFRRTLLDRVGGFAEDLAMGEDLDYHARLIEAGMRVGLCEVDGIIYRRHETNATNDRKVLRQGLFNMLHRKLARARQAANPDHGSSSQ